MSDQPQATKVQRRWWLVGEMWLVSEEPIDEESVNVVPGVEILPGSFHLSDFGADVLAEALRESRNCGLISQARDFMDDAIETLQASRRNR